MKRYREEIDRIDRTILELLIERSEYAKKIGEVKKRKGLQIHVPERERQIIEKLLELNKGRFPEKALVRIFREIISACLSLEQPLKVGYLGPVATFTHQAALEHFGISAKYIPLSTIKDVFEEVERGNIDYGVVPVENTIEGVVNYTRFLVIGKRELGRSGKDKTSLLFAVKDEAGALYKALEPFYKHNVNLTKIESRPSKEKSWDYVFFVDLEGHIEDENVKRALEELKNRTKLVRVLGSYPIAI